MVIKDGLSIFGLNHIQHYSKFGVDALNFLCRFYELKGYNHDKIEYSRIGGGVLLERGIPHCLECKKPITPGQTVFMDFMNSLQHATCSNWEAFWIKDMGKIESVIAKYPQYFNSFITR